MDRHNALWTLGAISLLLIGGCHRADSPAKVEHDVRSAERSAARDTAKAEEHESNVDRRSASNLSSEQQKADSERGSAAADTAMAEAQAAYKVALAKCEALSGDRQIACQEEAKAQLDEEKVRARSIKEATR